MLHPFDWSEFSFGLNELIFPHVDNPVSEFAFHHHSVHLIIQDQIADKTDTDDFLGIVPH
jgi:hypothetical protein